MNDLNKTIKNVSEKLQSNEKCCCNSYYCSGVKEETKSLIRYLRTALYPEAFSKRIRPDAKVDSVEDCLEKAYNSLLLILPVTDKDIDVDKFANDLFCELPSIKSLLELDIEAAYKGDPAAKNTREIILSYPGFEAISIYRIAHFMYIKGAVILSRMVSEVAHSLTGIDIHPGANIGKSFFIDHGTGVVIGETCNIGDNVKIYQGVTLGALSFPHDEKGNIIKGNKRHPDVGNNVIIYANATILGGNTKIGENTTIGGNVWLTHSVGPNQTILK